MGVALLTLVFLVVTFFYKVNVNTKNHELYVQYCNEILSWHEKVVNILMLIRMMHDKKMDKEVRFIEKLAELSAIIEVGRFFFPNIDSEKYGNHKPAAYRGYKQFPLELLVDFFEEAQMRQTDSQKNMLRIQRKFTSCIFESIEPVEYIFKRHSYFSDRVGVMISQKIAFAYSKLKKYFHAKTLK